MPTSGLPLCCSQGRYRPHPYMDARAGSRPPRHTRSRRKRSRIWPRRVDAHAYPTDSADRRQEHSGYAHDYCRSPRRATSMPAGLGRSPPRLRVSMSWGRLSRLAALPAPLQSACIYLSRSSIRTRSGCFIACMKDRGRAGAEAQQFDPVAAVYTIRYHYHAYECPTSHPTTDC